ncbi:MAG: hypothetical protein B6V02_01505 [Thermoprotei archaeon ex4572_64]|nr:MAG: hypothetical protein B6V02_01505 [Thermoprotei archaeon ex4572_64]
MTGKSNKSVVLDIEANIKGAVANLKKLSQVTATTMARMNRDMAKVRVPGNVAPNGQSKSQYLAEQSLEKAEIRKRAVARKKKLTNSLDENKEALVAANAKIKIKKKTVGDLKKLNKAEYGQDFADKVLAQHKSINKSIPAMDRYRLATRMVKKDMDKLSKGSSVPFAGYAMSLMFFGMALKKTFDTIWKSSTKTFQDISHSVEGTVTQFDLMEGSMKYLGFVVGAALEPVVGYLIPIIDKVADLAEEFPNLTAAIVIAMGVLGTIFFVGGSAKLAWDGFVGLGLAISGVKTKATALKSFSWSSLGNTIQSGIGIISIGFAFVKAKDAIENLKSGKVFSGVIDAIETGLFAIGGGMLLKGNKAGGYLIGIGVGLELVQKNTFIQSIMSIMAILTSFFYTAGLYIGELFANGFSGRLKANIYALLENDPILKHLGSLLGVDFAAEKEAALNDSTYFDFDFNKEFKEIYTAQMVTAKKWDESIGKVLDDLDKVTENMYHADKTFSDNLQLFSSDSDFKKLMDSNALNPTQLSKLLSLDAEVGHKNTLNDKQWAMAEKEYKEQTGNYYTIESINVTTNDLADMLSQVNSLAGI